ncbi:MAG: dTMP kinase [Candidatus Bathyarchaeia archaeon]
MSADKGSRKPGTLIALEGIDQAGKRTQARILGERLRGLGLHVAIWSFPDYSTELGREIGAFLRGERRYGPEVRHLLYAANKWERAEELSRLLGSGTFLIIDRYKASNIAYGMAKGLDRGWLANLEAGLPDPDLTILIDIPPEESLRRKAEARDAHEADLEFLGRVRRNYLAMAEEMGWPILDGRRESKEVSEDVWRAALKLLSMIP